MRITDEMVNRALDCMPASYWANPPGSCSLRTRIEVILSAALRDEPEAGIAVCKHCRVPIARNGGRWNHLSLPQPEHGRAFSGYLCARPPQTEAEPIS